MSAESPIRLASRPRPADRAASIAHVAPFAAFVAILGLERALNIPPAVAYPIRVAVPAVLLLIFSRPYLKLRPSMPAVSIVLGVAVFVIWIAPDRLFGYRHFWLFENSFTGQAVSSLGPQLHRNVLFLVLRVAGSVLLVPLVEELFWRAWMMRWLIDNDFLSVRLGTYAPTAFWVTAILFASEHGAYWEVGLAAGIIYNWWLIRTKNLADCILAHAVTNAVLALYVLAYGQWQYWL